MNWAKPISARWEKREKMKQEELKKAEMTKANTLEKHGLTEADLVQTNDPENVVFEKYIRLAQMGINPHTGLPITDEEKWKFQYAAHTKTVFDVIGTVGGAYAGQYAAKNGFYGKTPKTASEAKGVENPVEVVGKGNTGRTKPNTLNEQIAMHEVTSNPLKNATELPIKMKDTRWPFEDGWVKMQNNVKLSNGDTISIHYVYNKKTGLFDDFKFK